MEIIPCRRVLVGLYFWHTPRDLARGTLFQCSCAIQTSPTNCSDDSWTDTFLGKHEHGALWLLIRGALEKHLLTYLLTYLQQRSSCSSCQRVLSVLLITKCPLSVPTRHCQWHRQWHVQWQRKSRKRALLSRERRAIFTVYVPMQSAAGKWQFLFDTCVCVCLCDWATMAIARGRMSRSWLT